MVKVKGENVVCEMLNVKGVMEMLDTSESTSYKLIRQMNSELADKGYLIIRGKVPRSYVEKRFFGFTGSHEGA